MEPLGALLGYHWDRLGCVLGCFWSLLKSLGALLKPLRGLGVLSRLTQRRLHCETLSGPKNMKKTQRAIPGMTTWGYTGKVLGAPMGYLRISGPSSGNRGVLLAPLGPSWKASRDPGRARRGQGGAWDALEGVYPKRGFVVPVVAPLHCLPWVIANKHACEQLGTRKSPH